MWILASLSVVVGGLAISSIIFRSVNVGAALRPGAAPVEDLFLVMPFLWIALVAGFGYLAYREIRSTKRGYTYKLSTLLLGTLLASCVLGIAFFSVGAGFALDRFAARHVPFHTDLERIQRDRWEHPQDGFLVGVVGTTTEAGMMLLDPGNIEWQVTFAETLKDQKIQELTKGERVGIRGMLIDVEARTFLACDIRSLELEGRGPLRFPPPPGIGIERKTLLERSNGCEDVRPLD